MQGSLLNYADALAQIDPEDFPTVEKLSHRLFDEELAIRQNLWGDGNEKGFRGTVKYTRSDGRELEDTIADLLTQMVLHGMQHRVK